MTTETKQNHSEQQAKAQLESIVEMVASLKSAETNEEYGRDAAIEDAQQIIREDALDVQVRGPWHTPGATERENTAPAEFFILLCTGGPAVRLVGTLSAYCEPESVRLEHQDWGMPWTEYHDVTETQMEAMLTYCQQFYFGE